MSNVYQAKIIALEQERANIEKELKAITDNLEYFESSQLKYDIKISDFNNRSVNDDAILKQVSFLKKSREDLINRISILSNLRSKKIKRIDEINVALKSLY